MDASKDSYALANAAYLGDAQLVRLLHSHGARLSSLKYVLDTVMSGDVIRAIAHMRTSNAADAAVVRAAQQLTEFDVPTPPPARERRPDMYIYCSLVTVWCYYWTYLHGWQKRMLTLRRSALQKAVDGFVAEYYAAEVDAKAGQTLSQTSRKTKTDPKTKDAKRKSSSSVRFPRGSPLGMLVERILDDMITDARFRHELQHMVGRQTSDEDVLAGCCGPALRVLESSAAHLPPPPLPQDRANRVEGYYRVCKRQRPTQQEQVLYARPLYMSAWSCPQPLDARKQFDGFVANVRALEAAGVLPPVERTWLCSRASAAAAAGHTTEHFAFALLKPLEPQPQLTQVATRGGAKQAAQAVREALARRGASASELLEDLDARHLYSCGRNRYYALAPVRQRGAPPPGRADEDADMFDRLSESVERLPQRVARGEDSARRTAPASDAQEPYAASEFQRRLRRHVVARLLETGALRAEA